jgi:hypothetical protein
MGQMMAPKPLIIIIYHLGMSRDDGMHEHGIDYFYGCHQVGLWLQSWPNHRQFISRPNPNMTQNDSHGPDDGPKTIDYHHLGMSRDDGMDEHGIDYFYGCRLVGL